MILALGSWSASAASGGGGAQVDVTFVGATTYDINQTYQANGGACTTSDTWFLNWASTFQTTISDGKLQGAPGKLSLDSAFVDLTHSGRGCEKLPNCHTTASDASAAPVLSVSGSDPQRVQVQSVDGSLTAGCDPTLVAFIGRDAWILDQALPDAAASVINIPSNRLASGFSMNVDESTAPGHVTSNCTGMGPDASTNTSCDARFTWTANISITCLSGTEVGKVTMSEGQALPIGTVVCQGQTVKTGSDSRMEITLKDGSIMRVGPDSEVTIDEASFTPQAPTITLRVIFGIIWAKIGGADHYTVDTGSDAVGVRGSQSTASVDPRTGALSVHVIEGHGYVSPPGKREKRFGPGYTAIMNHGSVRLTTAWPAAQRALVPPGATPPAIGSRKLTVGKSGRGAQLEFTLDQPAALTLTVMRGRRAVAKLRARGAAGYNLVRLRKHLRRGNYTAVLQAINGGRGTNVSMNFRVR